MAVYEKDGWSIDFAGWKRKDLKAFYASSGAGDDGALPFFVRCIKAWPYPEFDPAKVEDYDELPLEHWAEAQFRVSEAIKSRFERTG